MSRAKHEPTVTVVKDTRPEAGYNVLQLVCPACNAQPGKACTQPTDTGRRAVPWVHSARDTALADAIEATTKAVGL